MFLIDLVRNSPDVIYAILGVAGALLAILGAIVLHEIAHGYAALINGDDTAKLMGRLTLNPARHFNLLGFAMFLIVGFGFAKPVPINPANFKNYKRGSIMVSVAGIATNIVLAFLFVPVAILSYKGLYTAQTQSIAYLMYFLYLFSAQFVTINVSLALFNLLPLYPLDGYRLINCFVSSESRFLTFLRRYSGYILIGLIVLSYMRSVSPLYWYINKVGGLILDMFYGFWGLLGVG